MHEIIPALLETGYDGVAARLASVAGQVRTVQLDVCDGVFVPSVTWPFITAPAEGKSLNLESHFKEMVVESVDMPHWEDFDFELDLMVLDVKRLLPDLLAIGPSRVYFHYEALSDPDADIEELIKLMPTIIEPGIAIGVTTDPALIFPMLDAGLVMAVQCMGIAEIGHQHEPFDERVLEQVRVIRERYPHIQIAVDGGVSLETAPKLIAAGATHLVAGSAIFTAPGIEQRIAEFKKVIQ